MIIALVFALTQAATSRPAPRPSATPVPAQTPAAAVKNPLAGTAKADTTPRALGAASPTSSSLGSLGSRVKLNREKAKTIFTQDVVPTPTGPEPAVADATKRNASEQLEKAIADERDAEKGWREREADRRARLADARATQQEICARYAAAANNAGLQDGRISDAAGAILGALLADCTTATKKADAIEAERARVEEDCRKTPGCKPGWLR